MNSSADLKDFVGRHGGVVCTSSNAEGVLQWAFNRAGPNGAVLFFPDQHLGRNTGLRMGITEEQMPTWTPNVVQVPTLTTLESFYGTAFAPFTSDSNRAKSQISVNVIRMASSLFILNVRKKRSTLRMQMVQHNTSSITSTIFQKDRPLQLERKSTWSLVLADDHPDKHIECLDPEICPCSTMYMIHPAYLMDLLRKLAEGQVHNQITVSNEVQEGSLLALERMLSIRV